MPTERDQKPDAAARANRPNTIDLTATEIKTEPPVQPQRTETATDKAESKPEAAAASADAVRADGESEPRHSDADAETPHASERPADSTPAARPGQSWRVAGAVAAALVLFAVGVGAGYWLSIRDRAAAPSTAAPVADQALQERIAKIESMLKTLQTPPTPDAQLLARIAAAEAAVKTASQFIATRDRRLDEIATLAQEASGRAAKAAAAAEAAEKASRTASAAQPQVDIDAFARRIDALEAVAKSNDAALKANQAALARQGARMGDDARSRLAIAALALRDAAEGGESFKAELAVLKSLAADDKSAAALESFAAGGIPTAQVLSRELVSLMPALWKSGAQEPGEGSFLARLQANAERIVRVRPAGEREGDNPGDVKARIEQRALAGDVNGALAELSKLPADARAPAEAWIAKAKARNAALAAARALSQQAIDALAKAGS